MPSLPPPCRWLDSSDGSYLLWNASCIASVKPRGDHWAMELEWQGRVRRGRDETLVAAKDRIERYVISRTGLPRRRRGS